MNPKKNPTPPIARRLAIIGLCVLGLAGTCHGVLSGHSVHTFEEALRLARQKHTDPSLACAALRAHVVEAIRVLREAGPDGAIAVEAIHQESR